jgi:hypothetical protein
MGRKAFVNDLRDASLPERFIQISSVTSGDDDGTIKFVFRSAGSSVEGVAVDAMVSGMLLFHSNSERRTNIF